MRRTLRRRPANFKVGLFRGRSKVRPIPILKVVWGHAGFITRVLVLLLTRGGPLSSDGRLGGGNLGGCNPELHIAMP